MDREMASVARQPAAATSMMARVDRLDLVLGYLEELHHHRELGGGSNAMTSSSSPSTATTNLSAESSPRGSWRRACRPAKEVLDEAHAKGSLVDRIAFHEDRVLKMEDDMEITPEAERDQRKEKLHADGNKKKGLKSLVRSCVRGKFKTKTDD